MSTDGVLESRVSVTAGETEAKREKNERQTAAVSCSMPSSQLAAEPGTEWRSSGSRYRSCLRIVVRLVSILGSFPDTAGEVLSAGERVSCYPLSYHCAP